MSSKTVKPKPKQKRLRTKNKSIRLREVIRPTDKASFNAFLYQLSDLTEPDTFRMYLDVVGELPPTNGIERFPCLTGIYPIPVRCWSQWCKRVMGYKMSLDHPDWEGTKMIPLNQERLDQHMQSVPDIRFVESAQTLKLYEEEGVEIMSKEETTKKKVNKKAPAEAKAKDKGKAKPQGKKASASQKASPEKKAPAKGKAEAEGGRGRPDILQTLGKKARIIGTGEKNYRMNLKTGVMAALTKRGKTGMTIKELTTLITKLLAKEDKTAQKRGVDFYVRECLIHRVKEGMAKIVEG